jgi:hypothetical protein
VLFEVVLPVQAVLFSERVSVITSVGALGARPAARRNIVST